MSQSRGYEDTVRFVNPKTKRGHCNIRQNEPAQAKVIWEMTAGDGRLGGQTVSRNMLFNTMTAADGWGQGTKNIALTSMDHIWTNKSWQKLQTGSVEKKTNKQKELTAISELFDTSANFNLFSSAAGSYKALKRYLPLAGSVLFLFSDTLKRSSKSFKD